MTATELPLFLRTALPAWHLHQFPCSQTPLGTHAVAGQATATSHP
jgi:hypothetical protein